MRTPARPPADIHLGGVKEGVARAAFALEQTVGQEILKISIGGEKSPKGSLQMSKFSVNLEVKILCLVLFLDGREGVLPAKTREKLGFDSN